MNLSNRKNVKTLGILGLFLIAVAGFILVLQPLLSQNAKYSEQITVAEAEQATILSKLDLLRLQKETISEVEKLDEELSKEFPGAADTPGLINMISQTAAKSGMSSKNITNLTAGIPTLISTGTGTDAAAPAPAEEAAAPVPGASSSSNIAEIPLDISLEGDLDELSKFASNLKDSPRNLVISSFNVSNEGAEGGKSTATIAAKTYIYQTVPKVGQPAGTSK